MVDGEAELARLVPNNVYSPDHVAINESVTACDMSATGLADQTFDVAVFAVVNGLELSRISSRGLSSCTIRWLVAELASSEGKLEELLSVMTVCGF